MCVSRGRVFLFSGNRNWFWFIMLKGDLKLIVKFLLYQPSALLVRRNFMVVVTKMDFKSAGEVVICYPCLTLNHTNVFIWNVDVTSTGPCQSEVIACIHLKRKERVYIMIVTAHWLFENILWDQILWNLLLVLVKVKWLQVGYCVGRGMSGVIWSILKCPFLNIYIACISSMAVNYLWNLYLAAAVHI